MDRRDFFKRTAGAVVVATLGLKLRANQTVIKAEHYDTIIMDDLVEVGDVLHVPRTGEHIFISGKENDRFLLSRGFGNSKAQPVKPDDSIWILGSATQEPPRKPPSMDREQWEEELKPVIIGAGSLFKRKV